VTAITVPETREAYDSPGGFRLPLQSVSQIDERRRASKWTRIHPVFAIGQLLVFLVSAVLLVLYFNGRVSFHAVHISVLIKVAFMAGAVITGAFWEKDVYGKWWFANEYFIEDVMTVNVFGLHALYLFCVYVWPQSLPLSIALLSFAYFVYGVNVGQYIWRHALNQKHDRRAVQRGERAA
jgi:3-vinyl bacteriochlorophyllide hydratase